jgi:hypothetical protein
MELSYAPTDNDQAEVLWEETVQCHGEEALGADTQFYPSMGKI